MSDQGLTPQSGPANMAGMRFGIYNQQLPLAGKTVKQARDQLANMWNVPKDAQAYNGKQQLSDDHIIEAGEQLEWQRRTGEKG